MKEKHTKYTCDKCGMTTLETDNDGFPYRKEWSYIHNFTGKAPKPAVGINHYEHRDKHFCSNECLMSFVKNEIYYIAEDDDPVIPTEDIGEMEVPKPPTPINDMENVDSGMRF